MAKKTPAAHRLWLLTLIGILALGAFLSLHFFYGPSWVNGSDNYIYASEAQRLAATGNVYFGGLEDNVKLLLFFGMAIFVKALGYSLFSVSLFGVFCFLGTAVAVYLIGKELYDRRAGLIGAFLYSIFPLVVTNSSNAGDDVPMVFFVSLAVLFAVLALRKGNARRAYYALTGFTAAISYLIVPEGAIGAAIVLAIFGMDTILNLRRKKALRKAKTGLALAIAGVIAALAVTLLLGFVENGHWLSIIYDANLNLAAYVTSPGAPAYLNWLFPVPLLKNIAAGPFFSDPSLQNLVALLKASVGAPYVLDWMAFGYFGFAFLISAAYLLIIRDKRLAIPLLWFMIAFLYLGFGSQSITTYVPVLSLTRFALILCPAIALVVAFCLTHAIEYAGKKGAATRAAAYAAVSCVLIFLFVSSFFTIRYIDYSQRSSVSPLVQTGEYIDSLGPNATVFGPCDLPWIAYTDYRANLVSLGYIRFQGNCSVTGIFNFKPGDYMVGMLDGNYSQCGFAMVFKPRPITWLEGYTAFDNQGMNLSNVAVYLYR